MAQSNASDSESSPTEKTPTGWHQFWSKEYEAASKRLRPFQKQGNIVTRKFLDDRKGVNSLIDGSNDNISRLNFFHTNISTMQSMLYGSTPRIDVSREHQDPDDDIARVAAVLYQRILQADVDPSGEDVPTVLKSVLQDRLLPGLGIARVRYDFETEQVPVPDPLTGVTALEKQVTEEEAAIEYINWQDALWGWGRTWNEIPWWGFRSWLDKEEATARFGKKAADNLEYKNQLPTGSDTKDETFDTDQKSNIQKAEIWEFWNKKDKKVFWWSAGADIILDAKDDPLQLDGFWPIPKPLTANITTTLYEPKADWVIAQDLYNEIDELQSRITTITRAVKVVGVYDSGSEGVQRMMSEGMENELIPVDNWAMWAEKGGIAGAIGWFPVGEIVQTLSVLRQMLGETIDLLYQVTGMSDVLRGANTDQYTSDGTNQLKAKFGSIRIQALQDEFARFASDLEALKAEVVSKHFSPQSIMRQSSAQFLPEADRDKIIPAVQLMQSEDIKWRVDIRPESIAMIDYAQLKSERTEFLTAMATYLQSAQAVVKSVPGSLPILLEMLKWGMAGFKGSDYLEGTMDRAIDMAKKAPIGGDDKGGAEKARQEGEMAKIEAKLASDMQIINAKGQQEMAKIQNDHMANMREIAAKDQADTKKIMTDLRADLQVIAQKLNSDLKVEEAQSMFAIAEQEVQHTNATTENAQEHAYNMREASEVNTNKEDD